MSPHVTDQDQRDRALNSARSFLVQAPAGSGKTELLIQRYLALLPLVDQPEEILAITFTRKAAAEMRQRIHQALVRANRGESAEEPHERLTLELAQRALQRNREMEWDLLAGSTRLKVQTIDSLCAGLVRQMPVLSQFGYQPEIAGNPEELYLQAARETLEELDSGQSWSESVSALVRHLDNDLERIARLIAAMMGKRDQWLRHVATTGSAEADREGLERALSDAVREGVAACRRAFPDDLRDNLREVAVYAGNNLAEEDPESYIAALAAGRDPFSGDEADHGPWLGLAELLLTKQGQWRKSTSKTIGFPAPSKAGSADEAETRKSGKESFNQLLEALSDYPRIRDLLQEVRCLPETAYSEEQWSILQALLQILKLAAAQLQLVFRAKGEVDFQEIALRALQALGDPQDPTDLTLALDYRLSHILIDEFQDTSISQFELLQRLTAGWQPDDGRTLFAVGDPMQSIYLFRDAEVGLFLRARDRGLGQIRPEFLSLEANFRSSRKVVDWINHTFSRVMPSSADEEDEVSGRIAYSPSTGLGAPSPEEGVTVHPLADGEDPDEAELVAAIASRERESNPEGTTAVLVRSRSHLRRILPRLRQEGLAYRAVEIETLRERPVVSDLVSLTKALSHPGDRLSWLSLLRAPWCGLCLADLHVLAGETGDRPILDSLRDSRILEGLTREGKERVQRLLPVLERAVSRRQRVSLRRRVETAWTELGGPACAASRSDLNEAECFFELLESDFSFHVSEFTALDQAVENLYAPPDPEAGSGLQVMTIHKAKGLEFDSVILPALDRTPPPQQHSLLLWQERPGAEQGEELLMAPIVRRGQDEDPIYGHLKRLATHKGDNELIRLMYVACTRARSRLHLVGRAREDRSGVLSTPSRSLLACIWPGVEEDFENARAQRATEEGESSAEAEADGEQIFIETCRRLTLDWERPEPPKDLRLGPVPAVPEGHEDADDEPLFDWAGETVRKAGVATHRLLHRICLEGGKRRDPDEDPSLEGQITTLLRSLGVPEHELAETAEMVRTALANTLQSPEGRWILKNRANGHCELPLTGMRENGPVSVVLDRTFVDGKGRRWIIDYKAGWHKGSDAEAFLNREMERYRPQLEHYAQLMSQLENRSISLGLYFPLVQGWRQWDWS
ncbi:MAG: UvrD-helicase domain-containing protein [Desulfohalobiaceae bacterium]